LLCTAEKLDGEGRELFEVHCALVRFIAITVFLVDTLGISGEQFAHHRQGRAILILTDEMDGQRSILVLLPRGLWVFFQQYLHGLKALGAAHVTRHIVKRQRSVWQPFLCSLWVLCQ
jgi:hypothetical protein